MPLSAAKKTLWTPGGEMPLAERDVIFINATELRMLSLLHEFAGKYGISVVCQRCDHAFTGQNSGQESQPGVSCLCREFRYPG